MKKVKFFKTLEQEVEGKYKDNKVTYFDMTMAVIVFLLFSYEISLSSYIYFYNMYSGYSLIMSIILCILVCYLIPKYYGKNFVTALFQMLMPMLILMFSFWTIPKAFHYLFLETKEICIKGELTYKLSARQDEGRISFDIDYLSNEIQVPRKLISFGDISGISYDEYLKLPSIGSKIKICGEMSKVGYQYNTIEEIK